VPLQDQVRHAARAQVLAHGEARLAGTDHQRIDGLDGHVPVGVWHWPTPSMDLPIFAASGVAGSDAGTGSAQTGIK